MAGCGYVCPVCEGRGYSEEGDSCTFCVPSTKVIKPISDEEWMNKVHENCSCSDIGKSEND